MNVKNILCPVDFSEGSDAALAYATSLSKDHEAELHIVFVYEEPYAYTEGGFAGYTVEADMDNDKKRLLEVTPPSADVAFRREFLVGSPATTLLNYAEENQIDLIVMGTHGRTGLSRLLMGSVAEAVVRKAPCPVLTIKTPVHKATKAKENTTAS